jgi:YegS/Rv2252/BmrU family lipid kinase
MNRRILLIANPGAAAGRTSARWEKLLDELQRRKLDFDHAITDRPRQGVELAREASGKYDIIAAVGGDGTMNEVANGILLAGDTNTALAVIPFGTGNDLARMLRIRSVEDALDALAHGGPRSIDAIEISCKERGKPTKYFALLYAAAGFAGEVGKRTTAAVKAVFGTRFCYSVGFFRALVTFESPTMRVRCGERVFEGRMFLVSAAKAEVIGGGAMRLSPGARIDDGTLTVNIVGNLGRLETLRCFPRLLRGTHITHPKVNCFAAPSLTVESEPAVELQLDGEMLGCTPATFEVRPQAIKILMARNPTAA